MAVKLSSYYSFRNNYLVRSLEDRFSAQHYFGKALDPEDSENLKFIVEELDRLKEDSGFQDGAPVLTEHVAISNVVELKDATSDVEVAASCLMGIHGIMEKYLVDIEMYDWLNRCFEEMGVEPPEDVCNAVKHAAMKRKHRRDYVQRSICWIVEKKSIEMRKSTC